MGIWDRLFGRKPGAQTPPEAEPVRSAIEVGAKIETETDNFTTFNDRNITFTGELAGYDYTAILRDKQNVSNLYSMFQ